MAALPPSLPCCHCRGGPAAGGVTLSKSVGAYFHSDGYLAKEVIKADTEELLEQLIEAKSK